LGGERDIIYMKLSWQLVNLNVLYLCGD
jgi:hypothetical protein